MKSATAHPDPLAFGERVAQKSQHCVSSQQNPDPVQQSRSCRQRQLAPSLLSAPCEYTQRNGRRSCSSKLLTRGRRRKTRSTSASCVCRKEPAVLPSPSRASFGRRQQAPRCPRLLALFAVCPVANAHTSLAVGRRRKTRDTKRGTSCGPCKVQPPAPSSGRFPSLALAFPRGTFHGPHFTL